MQKGAFHKMVGLTKGELLNIVAESEGVLATKAEIRDVACFSRSGTCQVP